MILKLFWNSTYNADMVWQWNVTQIIIIWIPSFIQQKIVIFVNI